MKELKGSTEKAEKINHLNLFCFVLFWSLNDLMSPKGVIISDWFSFSFKSPACCLISFLKYNKQADNWNFVTQDVCK